MSADGFYCAQVGRLRFGWVAPSADGNPLSSLVGSTALLLAEAEAMCDKEHVRTWAEFEEAPLLTTTPLVCPLQNLTCPFHLGLAWPLNLS